jgi:E3 ubiquitin-protein ligase SHPRH
MGPKKQDQTTGELVATIGLGQADGQEEGSSGMNGQEEIEAEISPAIVEEQKRQADLKRLNTIAEQTQREISSMIMMGEFGSKVSHLTVSMLLSLKKKINFLIKHLLYYRVKDKTARHVVFSNWSDSLYSMSHSHQDRISFKRYLALISSVVIQALRANNISFVSFDKGGKQGGNIVDQFIKDQSITVFLLHAEKER